MMQNLPGSFEFEGLLSFPRDSATPLYYFVPLHADLDRTPDGLPMFSLITVGTSGYLMFTALWRATDKALEALRIEISRLNKIADPSTIQLALAPVTVTRCDLLLGDGSGELRTIATNATSGVPPYAALFSISLTEEQFAAVAAAVNGTPGRLVVEYDISLITPATGTARLVPLSSRFVPWLREYLAAGPAGLRAAIQEALDEGLATIQLELPEQPPEDMVGTLYDRVLTRATETLPILIGSTDASMTTALEVSVTLVEDVRRPLYPQVDLAALDLSRNRIMISGTTNGANGAAKGKETNELPLRVKVGFDSGDAPLAWVRLQKGDAEALLKPPQFGPANIPAGPVSQPLRVTAGYTDGTQAYKKELVPEGGTEVVLEARDLGLAMVTVDARPLAKAGARSAQVWLRYGPPHLRSEQRYSLQFGDNKWVSHVWLAIPTQASLRYLDYQWQAVLADGRSVNQSATYSGSSDIVLAFSGGTTDVTN